MSSLYEISRKFILPIVFTILLLAVAAKHAFASGDYSAPTVTWDISETGDDNVSASLFELSPDDCRIEISGHGKMKDFSETAPPPWVEYSHRITVASIGAEVENVGSFAFNDCENLKKLIIEGTLIILPADTPPFHDETVICAHLNSNVSEYLSINNPERFSALCEFENSVCTVCSYQCTEHKGGEADCTRGALCEICGSEYKAELGHDLGKIIPEKSAGCTDDGMKEHYICSRCGLYFDGEENLTSKDALLIPKTHKLGNLIPYSAPSCTDYGILAHRHCSRCGKNFDEMGDELDNIYLPATDHKGGKATCTSGAICDVCNNPYGEIDESCHTFSDSFSYDLTAHWYECACGEVKEREEHSFNSRVIKPQTVEEEGIVEYSCTCGHSYLQKLPKLSNTDNAPLLTDSDGKSITWIFVLIGSALGVGIIALTVILIIRKRNK